MLIWFLKVKEFAPAGDAVLVFLAVADKMLAIT
jgi:hypothetical protein